MSRPRVPSELKASGRKLWRFATNEFGFEPHETATLLQACRCLDRLDLIALELTDATQTVRNSKGVTHPLIVEGRQQALAYARLLASLRIPDSDGTQPQHRGGARGFYGKAE